MHLKPDDDGGRARALHRGSLSLRQAGFPTSTQRQYGSRLARCERHLAQPRQRLPRLGQRRRPYQVLLLLLFLLSFARVTWHKLNKDEWDEEMYQCLKWPKVSEELSLTFESKPYIMIWNGVLSFSSGKGLQAGTSRLGHPGRGLQAGASKPGL